MSGSTNELGQTIVALAEERYARALVRAYFDESQGFAGAMFDGLDPGRLLGNNPADRFIVDDITAASLLDVRFGPKAVRELLGSTEIGDALRKLRDVNLWEATSDDFEAGDRLWSHLRSIPGLGRTRTSKLLARKRPHLVPIADSVVLQALGLDVQIWAPLAEALKSQYVRSALESLRPDDTGHGASLLRLLDVLVWMANSRSSNAVRVQIEVDAPPTRHLR